MYWKLEFYEISEELAVLIKAKLLTFINKRQWLGFKWGQRMIDLDSCYFQHFNRSTSIYHWNVKTFYLNDQRWLHNTSFPTRILNYSWQKWFIPHQVNKKTIKIYWRQKEQIIQKKKNSFIHFYLLKQKPKRLKHIPIISYLHLIEDFSFLNWKEHIRTVN